MFCSVAVFVVNLIKIVPLWKFILSDNSSRDGYRQNLMISLEVLEIVGKSLFRKLLRSWFLV